MDEPHRGGGPPGRPPAGDLVGIDLAARLERWAAEARVDHAARQRSSERWLRQQAEEGGSLAGVLCDLAERAVPVAVRSRAGRQHRGRVRAVGDDFVALAPASAGDVVLALEAVSWVRAGPGAAPTGDRAARTALRLTEVLARLAAERERILVVALDGGEAVAGVLRSVGRDVAVVRLEGPEPATVYVPTAAIAEVILGAG